MRSLKCLFGILLALAVVSPVAAVAPTTVQVELTRSFIAGECPGFEVLGEFHLVRTEMTFYTADGTPVRRLVHVSLAGSRLINVTSGTSIDADGVRVITFDLVNGGSSSTGTNVHAVVPGVGTVGISAGRFIQDPSGEIVFEVGRVYGPITEAICTALSA